MGLGQGPVESVGIAVQNLDFYRGKRVFVTGHTGFKGSWLCQILHLAGAEVTGYSLTPPAGDSLFTISGIQANLSHHIGDVRDYDALKKVFDAARPELVLHLAAQPIVLESYKNPVCTYGTNVMGTVHLLECVRQADFSVLSVLNVTTDKVYQNREWCWGYRENEPLDGHDPYSNSKSCSELVTHSYKNSFFNTENAPALSTARAGNVIGGGDFAADRIIPDCVRAAIRGVPNILRNPHSTRPYQHVLEPLFAYLMIAEKQAQDKRYAGWYNVGPDETDCITTGELADLFCEYWPGADWEDKSVSGAPHEANFLKLDCSSLKSCFGWKPRWSVRQAVEKTVAWTKAWQSGADIRAEMTSEIKTFMDAAQC